MSSRARAHERKILQTQHTLHSHAEGTGSGTRAQDGSLLNPNQISELIMDNDSDKSLCDVAAMEDKEYCEEVLLEPHL